MKLFSFYIICISILTSIQQIVLEWNTTIIRNVTLLYFSANTSNYYEVFTLQKSTITTNYNFIVAEYSPKKDHPQLLTYMQLSENELNTQPLNFKSMSKQLYIDRNGFAQNKQQYVTISSKSLSNNSSFIYVYIYISNSSYINQNKSQFQYNLTVNLSYFNDCPNKCSSNGKCVEDSKCKCAQQFYGYDCSINPIQLDIGNNLQHILMPFEFNYFKAVNLKNYYIFLTVQSNNYSSMKIIIYQNSQKNNRNVSPFQYDQKFSLNLSRKWIKLTQSSLIWILIINQDSNPVKIQFSISQITQSISNKIIATSFGVAVLIFLFIIGICICIKCYRNRTYQIPQVVNNINNNYDHSVQPLTIQEFQKYFPSILYSAFKKILPQIKDLRNFQDDICTICLCNLTEDTLIRITYCSHIYHTECLNTWLKKSYNCPCCRLDFNKRLIQGIYKEIEQVKNKQTMIKNILMKNCRKNKQNDDSMLHIKTQAQLSIIE